MTLDYAAVPLPATEARALECWPAPADERRRTICVGVLRGIAQASKPRRHNESNAVTGYPLSRPDGLDNARASYTSALANAGLVLRRGELTFVDFVRSTFGDEIAAIEAATI